MRLLDLFCGAGGAAMGYHRAGFNAIVGVDHLPQKHYPFAFILGDALEYVREHGHDFDAIHASPPCQRYSSMSKKRNDHADLYNPTRAALSKTGLPYVIENVIGAPYAHGLVLCGSMFGLVVRRHRNFETSWLILQSLRCNHAAQGRPITVTGHSGGRPRPHSWKGHRPDWPRIMGMEWATPDEVTQAVPPAYTEFIGKQLLAYLSRSAHPGIAE